MFKLRVRQNNLSLLKDKSCNKVLLFYLTLINASCGAKYAYFLGSNYLSIVINYLNSKETEPFQFKMDELVNYLQPFTFE